jgi:hypothetical protein
VLSTLTSGLKGEGSLLMATFRSPSGNSERSNGIKLARLTRPVASTTGIRTDRGTVMEASHAIMTIKKIDMLVGSTKKLQTTRQRMSRMLDLRLPRSHRNRGMLADTSSRVKTRGKNNHTRKIGDRTRREGSWSLEEIKCRLMEARSREIRFSTSLHGTILRHKTVANVGIRRMIKSNR